MTKFNKEYIDLQVSGSDWSYGSAWGDQMEESIKQIFGPKDRSSVILDVGCGEGRGLNALYEMGFSKHSLFGIDISIEKLKAASNRGYLVINNDFHDLSLIPPKYFDYVYCSHTLEHSYDLNMALQSIIRVCSNTFYFIVPIGETLENVKKYNPSHISPIYDSSEISKYLEIYKEQNIIKSYSLNTINRMCPELWGEVNI